MSYSLSQIAPVGMGARFVRKRNTATSGNAVYRPTADDFISSFFAVLRRWESETRFLSDPTAITSHPSFSALVDNAQTVLPYIRDELSRNPSKLVWVLEDAFGEEPYEQDDVGNFEKMTNRWLDFIDRLG